MFIYLFMLYRRGVMFEKERKTRIERAKIKRSLLIRAVKLYLWKKRKLYHFFETREVIIEFSSFFFPFEVSPHAVRLGP